MDVLKSNMEKCKATLEEHARWSQLVREVKTLLEGGGRLADCADRIEVMIRSLGILKNLPGNEERETTCDTFKTSLLSQLRPKMKRDVSGGSSEAHAVDLIAPLQEYLYVFQKLGRFVCCFVQYSSYPEFLSLILPSSFMLLYSTTLLLYCTPITERSKWRRST